MLKAGISPLGGVKLPADLKEHAMAFLTLDGDEMLSTQNNLFEVVKRFAGRFVVDNNIKLVQVGEDAGQ